MTRLKWSPLLAREIGSGNGRKDDHVSLVDVLPSDVLVECTTWIRTRERTREGVRDGVGKRVASRFSLVALLLAEPWFMVVGVVGPRTRVCEES